MKKLIVDLDGTLTIESSLSYEEKKPDLDLVEQLRVYKKEGFEIIISTARNMRTHSGNVGLINVHTLPGILEWLSKHNVPFDEVWVGKPWCGTEGFYIDDRAVRPSEFKKKSYDELIAILSNEKIY